MSRTQKAIYNTTGELLLELVVAICSFILPRLILSHFGSSYNGITLSISQFIGCIALLKSGIGSVTRAALYKPLATHDSQGISEIVNATQGFMRKVALIFAGSVIVFAALYPFLVKEEFSWLFAFTLVLILSLSTFAQYFFGLPYQMVLQADQKNYVISIVTILSTIINTCIAAALILLGFGIHIVQLGSAFVFILPPIFYYIYVRWKYHIDNHAPANYQLISQRWDAFAHQLANFVNNNTDLMIITAILGVKEVSVYAIHYMIGNAIKKIVLAFGKGMTAAFGNMMAKGEVKILRARFCQFEVFITYASTTLLIITAVLLTPFVMVYTSGITDVNYYRPIFSLLVVLSVYLSCLKLPYEEIVFAAGRFRQTRNAAFVEAGIHVVLSIVFAYFFGLNGIVLGFIISAVYRIVIFHAYICNNIIHRSFASIFRLLSYTACVVIFTLVLLHLHPLSDIDSFLTWFLQASVKSIEIIIISTVIALLFFRAEMVAIYQTIKYQIHNKRKKTSLNTQ